MALKVNLNKSTQALKLSLEKRGIVTPPQMDLAFDLDVSGSFDDEHRDGLTQALLERLVPWGMLFDPDQKLDMFTFSNREGRAHYVGEITPDTCEGYIRNKIIDRVPGYRGGTEYSYVLEMNLQHFGWIQAAGTPAAPKRRFGGIFGGRSASATAAPAATLEKKRSLVIFTTDGDNDDKDRTEQILAASEARKDEVYFLFIGISNQGGSFPFLKKIGDRFGNTGLVVIRDLKDFIKKSDEEINDMLIGEELVQWLKQ